MSELSLPLGVVSSSAGSVEDVEPELLEKIAPALLAFGAVGVLSDGIGVDRLASAFCLACSASRSRNSFCAASNEVTPSGVMSANAGERRRGVVVLKVRTIVEDALREPELLINRRANILTIGYRETGSFGQLEKGLDGGVV